MCVGLYECRRWFAVAFMYNTYESRERRTESFVTYVRINLSDADSSANENEREDG